MAKSDPHEDVLHEGTLHEDILDGFVLDGTGGPDAAARALPDAPLAGDACRPVHVAGPVVACIRERLAARAASLGWRLCEAATAGLHLLADGHRVDPSVRGLTARFLVPAGARALWLVSDAVVPAAVDGTPDRRALGVCVGRLATDDGFASQAVAADDSRLCVGFHDVEGGPRRWTAGRALVPTELWAHCRGESFYLRLEMTGPALPRWAGPGNARAG